MRAGRSARCRATRTSGKVWRRRALADAANAAQRRRRREAQATKRCRYCRRTKRSITSRTCAASARELKHGEAGASCDAGPAVHVQVLASGRTCESTPSLSTRSLQLSASSRAGRRTRAVVLVELRNLRHERVVGIGICEDQSSARHRARTREQRAARGSARCLERARCTRSTAALPSQHRQAARTCAPFEIVNAGDHCSLKMSCEISGHRKPLDARGRCCRSR